jgi:hypothetical protein
MVLPPPNLARFKLPSRLSRPDERPVKTEILRAIDEELSNIPIDYLKDMFAEAGFEYVSSFLVTLNDTNLM